MLSRSQISTMLSMQDNMNKIVNPDWITAGNQWLRAAMAEANELLDHHGGWKWWKHATPNIEQMQLELVDIWHFLLSQYLVNSQGDFSQAAQTIMEDIRNTHSNIDFDGRLYELKDMDIFEKIDLMVGLYAAKRLDVSVFISVMEECELSTDSLYLQYICKQQMNAFRQANGYKSGKYIKTWHGREDNEHLFDFVRSVDPQSSDVQSQVNVFLNTTYKTVLEKAASSQ